MTFVGKDAKISLSEPRGSTSMTDEATSEQTSTLFVIDDASKYIWDPSVSFTVKVNSSSVGASTYTLHYSTGAIEFNSSQTGNTVTISGSYFPRDALATASSFTLSIENNLEQINQFSDDGTRRLETVQDISVSFEQFEIVQNTLGTGEPNLEDLVLKTNNASSGKLVAFFYDMQGTTGLDHIGGWMMLDEAAFSAAADGVQVKELTGQGAKLDSTMSTQNVRVVDILRQ